MAQTSNLRQSGICLNMEHLEVISSAGGTSPENLPPLLRLISSSETSSVFDNYDRFIENHPDATFKQSSEVASKRMMDQEEAFPRNFNTFQPSMLPRPSVSSMSIHSPHVISISLPSSPVNFQVDQASMSIHSPHVISISLPSSPVNFQVDQAKRVCFQSQKISRQTDISNSKNSANQSFKIPEKRTRAKSKFYSQQIPTGKDSAREMAKQRVPDISSSCQHDGDNREKGKNYAYFKTRSGPGPLERQISHFHGENEAGELEICEIESLPAGRYFDALQGPELEILRDSEESVLPTDQQWPFLLRFPISCFGICLGLGSQAILWKTLAAASSMEFLHVPKIINLMLWGVALMTYILIFVTYILKCIFYFEAVRREYHHPVRVNFFFAPWIACMFLTIGVPPVITQSIHPALWVVFTTPVFILELKIYGQWMSGGRKRLSKLANPSNHLAIVGNFVGALLGAAVGWKEGATFFFAVGLAHYMVLFVTLYQRLPTTQALPKELHPVFFLFVAAPSVASLAWEKIQGDFDHVSRIAYFIALFLYTSLVVRLNFFRGFRFSVAWWAYTFPMTGAAVATIEYCNKVRHPFTQALAVALSGISAFTVLSLVVSTILHAFVWGTLFPNDIAIAISNTKPRTRKKNKEGMADGKTAICCEIGTYKSQVHAHKKQITVPISTFQMDPIIPQQGN